ncbi:FecR protein [Chitinophaga arvensicola]|uniref:FecR protein n=2 Tax=Chitinophaga arvensicola TaxID=29529 RepID=A0A1I0RUE8_9BACT|nr:FecR protein [Chitinophaga arvensicola]
MELPDHIAALYHRCIQGNATAAEQAALLQYLQEPGHEEILRAVLRQGLREQKPLTDLPPEREAAVWQAIIDATHPPLPVAPVYHMRWLRMAAAVGISAFIGISSFFVYKQYRSHQAPIALQTPLSPGGNKAILTLGDGRTITLDSISNGQIAGENGVVKQGNGKLAYLADQAEAVTIHTLTIPRGGQYQLQLPDGTQVWLNSASYIKYPTSFHGRERKVEISGEAYLDVARNAAQPFIVVSKGQRIQVLGTAFNLMAYPDEAAIKTTLINGAIKVIQAGTSKILKPGEQAAVSNRTAGIAITTPDLDNVLAWKEGKFRFYNTDIATIMRQVARWYDVEVFYQGTIPEEEFYGTIPKSENAAQILDVLELTHKVHFEIKGKRITVIPGPR